jgi:hypothetical protein
MPEYKHYSTDAFKSLISQGKLPIKPCVAKGLLDIEYVVKADESDDNIREFIASTADVDHEGDTIAVNGWDLKAFKKAGTFLWAHDRRLPPIGTPTKIWRDSEALRLQVRFPPEDLPHPYGIGFGHAVKRMYDERLMKGVSVGFNPQKFKKSEDEERLSRFGYPIDYIKQTLIEVSGTPVPANAHALHTARTKGIFVAPLQAWAEESRDAIKSSDCVLQKSLAPIIEQFLDSGSGPEHGGPTTVYCGDAGDAEGAPDTGDTDDTDDTDPTVTPSTPVEAPETPSAESSDTVDTVETDASGGTEKSTDDISAEDLEKIYVEHIDKAIKAESNLIDRLKALTDTLCTQGKLFSAESEQKIASVVYLLTDLLPTTKEGSQQPSTPKKPNGNKGLTESEFRSLVQASLKEQLNKLTGRLPQGD